MFIRKKRYQSFMGFLVFLLVVSIALVSLSFFSTANAGNPGPEMDCPTCQMISLVTECNSPSCNPQAPHLFVKYYRCLGCDGYYFFYHTETCKTYCY